MTRDRIVAAIRGLLADSGLDGLTIKNICERAGVKSGSFYNLFPSKEQAILTVVREAIAAVDPHPDAPEQDSLQDLIDAYVAFVEREPVLARIYVQMAVTGGVADESLRGRIVRHHRGRVERFAAAISHDRPQADPDQAAVAAEAVVAGLNGLTLAMVLDPSFDVTAAALRLGAVAGGVAVSRPG